MVNPKKSGDIQIASEGIYHDGIYHKVNDKGETSHYHKFKYLHQKSALFIRRLINFQNYLILHNLKVIRMVKA